mmetsp:Transcript_11397/g.36027  ORF Transcript_11397/g.36027 Transcript_11397/m.36027 type:complete len:109 (-) Transcript_11397:2-328(-)
MEVIVKEAMANGRVLASSNPAAAARLAPLTQAAADLGVSPDALALACVIAQPFRPMVLSGAACCDHLASNAEAAAASGKVGVVLGGLMEALRQDPEEYWAERAALGWN